MPALKILTVDQNRHFARAARDYLLSRQEVCRVECTTNPHDISDMCSLCSFDLVFIDERLIPEGKSGLDYLVWLKNQLPGARVIMLTLYEKAMLGNEKGYISRKVSRLAFASEVDALLKGKG